MSWWPQPFPIQEDEVLAVAWGFPGFTDDLTMWEVRIADYGFLVQYVNVLAPGRPSRFEEHVTELPKDFCERLRDKADKIGFARFSGRYPTTWDDLPSWHIEIRMADGTRKKVDVECDPNRTGQAAVEVESFFELWELIHRHAPFQLPEPKRGRSNRQLKMDARRQRRSDRKNERHESEPLDSEEGK